MYQRMLDKNMMPTPKEMESYCGKAGELFYFVNKWLSETYSTVQKTVFPYGNAYGWGVAHRIKNKLMCNVFPEENAFTVMIRLTSKQWREVYEKAQEYMKNYIDNKYSCSDGGWIHYRVTSTSQLDDIMLALTLRCS